MMSSSFRHFALLAAVALLAAACASNPSSTTMSTTSGFRSDHHGESEDGERSISVLLQVPPELRDARCAAPLWEWKLTEEHI
jgi:hypothetical protein